MFKSECLVLIFILVILAILYFNTYTVELFTSKKITINKEENKQLIADNLQRIIDTIEEYKKLDGIVKLAFYPFDIYFILIIIYLLKVKLNPNQQ